MKRTARRWNLRPLLILAVVLGFLPSTTANAQQRVTDQQIQKAIKGAIAHLQRRLPQQEGGHAALIALALLKTGVPADTPEINTCLDKIVKQVANDKYKGGPHHIYEAGVSLMALANADNKKYRREIGAIADYIMEYQRPAGEWDYLQPTTGDTSITQYAVLGLWEAVRSGVAVPRRVWDRAAAWHISRQLPDGSFTYHPTGVDGVGVGTAGSHSMTVAGTASLHVTRLHLYPTASDPDEGRSARGKKRGKKFGVLLPAAVESEEGDQTPELADASYRPTTRLSAIDKSISRGKKWLADHFTVVPKANWDLYYLYGLERLAALASIKEIDGHDWYAEGAAHLVATQSPGGTWSDGSAEDAATSFGVLFLTKATEKMLSRKARVLERRFGGGLLVGGRGLPDNLETVQVELGSVRVRKLKGPVDELLAELENSQSRQIESAQAALVETIATDDPEALIGQTERLLKLAGDKRPEVRRTVFWALGRTNDLRVVPTLIRGLGDADPDCMIEARNALRFISKKIDLREPPDEATAEQRAAAIALWKKWYLSVRPYDERDDLGEAPVK